MEPFKLLLGPAVVDQLATHLQRTAPGFDAKRFRRAALDGLDALELKARCHHLCAALEATLPRDFATVATAFEAAMAPPREPGAPEASPPEAGLSGWALWPVGEYVARHGLVQPARALEVLHALTQRFTAEFAIRPFLVEHPALAFETLARWAGDPSPHVRRLVSEGSRPRLPWGLQLKTLIADPSPTLPLLRGLQDDPHPYVRRSVANHLNDIAKDHPALLAEWLETWWPEAPPTRQALLRHAARTLVKRGDRRVLEAFGLGRALRGRVALSLQPAQVVFGDHVELTLTLESTAAKPQPLVVDYAVHHAKADGRLTAKVFKGWKLTLAAREARVLTKRHALKPITTRRYHAGLHRVEVLVNGQPVAAADFELLMPPPAARATPPRRSRP